MLRRRNTIRATRRTFQRLRSRRQFHRTRRRCIQRFRLRSTTRCWKTASGRCSSRGWRKGVLTCRWRRSPHRAQTLRNSGFNKFRQKTAICSPASSKLRNCLNSAKNRPMKETQRKCENNEGYLTEEERNQSKMQKLINGAKIENFG